MLFFGNIVKNTDNYKELSDCALRIIPTLEVNTLNNVDIDYEPTNNDCGYYNSYNMYNKVGYFNKEYYRFGVVFIYNNGTLSNVYNTIGRTLKETDSSEYLIPELYIREGENDFLLKRNYIKVDDFGWVADDNYSQQFFDVNSRGVCKIDSENEEDNTIFGIKFNIPPTVVKFLKENLGIRGLFFVRQKCVPNIIA